MKVCVYKGSEKIVRKSGVGRAIEHQEMALKKAGIELEEKIGKDTKIVHFNTVFPDSLLAAVFAKLRGKRVIYYGHSTMEDFRNSFKGSNLFAPIFRSWIKFCYNRGDLILTPTEYSRRILKRYGIKKPILALSNGIDTDSYQIDDEQRVAFRRKYHLPEEKKLILSVGHYMERKGILDFIEMAGRMPEADFFWFGYTSPKLVPKKVEEAIRKAPKNLHFPGYVEAEELKRAYQACDLFCFMSHEETEGIVVLEALACEIPLLLRDIPVYEDWLTDGIDVYKAKTTEEFVTKAREILSYELPNLTAEGRKRAEERSLVRIGYKLKRIYSRFGRKEKKGKASLVRGR